MGYVVDKNWAVLTGRVDEDSFREFSTKYGKFYDAYFLVSRLSGTFDRIPVLLKAEQVENVSSDFWKNKLQLQGRLVTYNDSIGRLCVQVRANTISKQEDCIPDDNQITLEARICRRNYRVTPFGRQITDLLLASNRNFGKASYVPSIAWGRDAVWLGAAEVGTKLLVHGRLQSRKYLKLLQDGTGEERETYELSITDYKVLTE